MFMKFGKFPHGYNVQRLGCHMYKDPEARKAYEKAYREKRRGNQTEASKECLRLRVRDEERKAKRIAHANKWRSAHPCSCGEADIACLDFHHVKGENLFGILNTKSHPTIEQLNAEMGKCIVICSNCHRKLHYRERNEQPEAE